MFVVADLGARRTKREEADGGRKQEAGGRRQTAGKEETRVPASCGLLPAVCHPSLQNLFLNLISKL
jgi:hypothetical protein